jgi:hypothetical protein
MPDPQGWPDATRPGVPMHAHRELPHLEIPGGGAPAIAAGCSYVWPVGTLKVDWRMMSRMSAGTTIRQTIDDAAAPSRGHAI